MQCSGAYRSHLDPSASKVSVPCLLRLFRPDPLTEISMTDTITILTERYGTRLAKKHTFDPTRGAWITETYSRNPKWFAYHEVKVTGIDDLALVLRRVAADPSKTIIRAKPNAKAAESVEKTRDLPAAQKEHFDPTSRRWVCIDIDNLVAPGCDIRSNPGEMIDWVIKEKFPPEFQDTRIVWQLSSSAGIKDPEAVKLHLWIWLSRPPGFEELKAWRSLGQFPVDDAPFRDVQIHYTANPSFEGAPDPCVTRWGVIEGTREVVEVPAIDLEAAKAGARERGENADRDGVRRERDRHPGKDGRWRGAYRVPCPSFSAHK